MLPGSEDSLDMGNPLFVDHVEPFSGNFVAFPCFSAIFHVDCTENYSQATGQETARESPWIPSWGAARARAAPIARF